MRSKKGLYAFLYAAMYFLIYFVVQIVIEGIYLLYCKATINGTYAQIYQELLKSIYALNVISTIISLWIYALIGKIRKMPIAKIVKNNPVTPATTFMVVICAIGARLCVSSYYFFANRFEPLKNSIDNSIQAVPEFTYFYQVLIALFSIVIIAPFFEEVLFRGIIMNEFSKIMRPWAAIFIQALFFGVAHLALFQSSFAFLAGILLGIIYYKTNSIKVATVFHSIFNFTAVFSQIVQNTTSSLIMLAFGMVIVFISMYYLVHTEY